MKFTKCNRDFNFNGNGNEFYAYKFIMQNQNMCILYISNEQILTAQTCITISNCCLSSESTQQTTMKRIFYKKRSKARLEIRIQNVANHFE